MSVTGPDGVEWVTCIEVGERVPGLSSDTLRSWIRRRSVRSRRAGRQVWVAWPDVLEHEVTASLAGWRRGRRRRQ